MSDPAFIRFLDAKHYSSSGFISWQRFASIELRPNEKLVAVKVDARGITYDVGRKETDARPQPTDDRRET